MASKVQSKVVCVETKDLDNHHYWKRQLRKLGKSSCKVTEASLIYVICLVTGGENCEKLIFL